MTAFLLFIITLSVYLLSNFGKDTPYNYFVLLADSFLHGRLYLTESFPWLNELVNLNGRFYVVYPPMPAILLIPFVLIFGTSFHQPFLSILIAAFNVSLCYLVLLKIYKSRKIALWVSILYAFGTMQWFHATIGSVWYISHIIAAFFLWLMLLEVINKQRLFLIGLLIGGAYLSRLPAVFAILFILVFLQKKLFFHFKPIIILALGILPALIFNFSYNYLRYGTFADLGYVLLPIFNEPWYRYGFLSIKYVPIHLKEMLTFLPKFSNQPPYIIPNLFSMAIWFITPAYLLAVFAKIRERISIASLGAAIGIAIPLLLHGGNGFTQFGYRYTLDFLPFLLILVASALTKRIGLWAKILIFLSIAVNLWGVVMINFLNIWTL